MKKNNILEILCFVLFCIGTIIITCFHEPWFDEFQAWGISKDSIYNILFVIPHLEGHPPLWHLILKCFSYFNVNCELGIKIPNLLFMFGAVWLLIFKSPFPRIVRLTLPFTYFIFYQYSIVSRPYSIFCFAIFLAALYYRERNNHPFKFISALALLCLSCAYGMVLSAGIIIVWIIEIIRKEVNGVFNIIPLSAFCSTPLWRTLKYFFKNFIKDKRFFSMFFIFLLCLVLTLIMYPDENVLVKSALTNAPLFFKIVYFLFIFPSDILISNYFDFSEWQNLSINLIGCFLGLLINIFTFIYFKFGKKLLLFYIPYLMFIILSVFAHIAIHHTGLMTIFYIFAFWCLKADFQKKENISSNFLIKVFEVFLCITILIQIYWGITAGINEIKYPYSSGRKMAEYIKENKLNNYKIMLEWLQGSVFINKKNNKKLHINKFKIPKNLREEFEKAYYEIKVINYNYQWQAVVINSYFNYNIIYTFNINHPNKQYAFLKRMFLDEADDITSKIKQKGIPDIIINQAPIYEIFDEQDLKGVKYILLKDFLHYDIWKNKCKKLNDRIFIREDLYNELYNTQKPNNENK